jgi:hypothetical protein
MTLEEILDFATRNDPQAAARLAPPQQQQGGALGGINLANTSPPQQGGYAATPQQLQQAQQINQTVNVPPSPRDPFGLNAPQTDEERGNVRQAGWSGAAGAVAPLLSDWRTTPAAMLAAAVAGYGQGAYGARQDVAAGRKDNMQAQLVKTQLDAATAKQKKDDAAQAQLRAQIAEVSKSDPERGRNLALIAQLDPSGISDFLNPKKDKQTPFGSTEAGWAVMNDDGSVREVKPGLGRSGPSQAELARLGLDREKFEWDKSHPGGGGASWRPATPDEVATAGADPKGSYLISSTGDMKQLGRQLDSATAPERADARLLGIKEQVEQAGGWDGVPQEDRNWYEMEYRDRAKPRVALDPATGLLTSTPSDVSYLPQPASLQPPAPPTPYTGQPMAFKPPPGAAPPRPQLSYGPTAGPAPVEQRATREQTTKFNDATAARNNLKIAADRMRALLAEDNGNPAMFGERARRMEIVSSQLVTAMGAAGNAGVLQQGDLDRYTALVGNPTGVMENLKSRAGLGTIPATLDEMERRAGDETTARAKEAKTPEFKTDAEAEAGVGKLPPGASFIGPDGVIYTKKAAQ